MTIPDPGDAIPEHVLRALDKALAELPQPDSRFERDRWRIVSRVAYHAVRPLFAAAERERLREMAEARKGELVLHGLLSDAVPWVMLIGLVDDIQCEAGDHVA